MHVWIIIQFILFWIHLGKQMINENMDLEWKRIEWWQWNLPRAVPKQASWSLRGAPYPLPGNHTDTCCCRWALSLSLFSFDLFPFSLLTHRNLILYVLAIPHQICLLLLYLQRFLLPRFKFYFFFTDTF